MTCGRIEVVTDVGFFSCVAEETKEEGRSPDHVHACPFCHFTCELESSLQQHVDSEHGGEKKAGLRCPLCEEACPDMPSLEKHAINVHSVNSEGLQRLMLLDLVAHQAAVGHTPLTETPRGPGYLCWKKGCNQYFPSAQALHSHFREIHGAAPRPSIAVSERHVYKYRCQQCSLAFKTVEKLQLHSQYHAIRDATKCLLCHRNFRSLTALQKHVSSDHPELSAAERHQFQASIVGAPVGAGAGPVLDPSTTALLRLESNKDDEPEELSRVDEPPLPPQQQAIEDYLNSDTMALDNYSDPARRFKCHRCRVAYTRQTYLSAHQKTLLHRRGEKLTYPMEKYLDPNRPYKCDVCKESFTQKNILLVHYNSVSHLHKLKKAMQDKETKGSPSSYQTQSEGSGVEAAGSAPPGDGLASASRGGGGAGPGGEEEERNKPYRCHVCRVAYSQQSTLDIHLRSVLHQTRAARLPDFLATHAHPDPSRPLVDHPPTPTSTPQPSPAPHHDAHTPRSPSTPQATPPGGHYQGISPSNSSSGSAQGSCDRCGGVWSSPEQGAQHAVLCGLIPPHLAFLPHAVSTGVSQPATLDAAWASLCGAGAAPLPQTQPPDRSLSPSECSIESLSTSRFTVPFRKSSRLHKHLLESFGFDLVVQYVENQQSCPSKEPEQGTSEDSKDRSNPDLPELNEERVRDAELIQGGDKGTSDEREKEADRV
ncbi:putative zinc finger homeobox protein 3 [Penaeus vannamei]|uniref:Putative zinc finger homeobox protein 3 n=1 Tax=Penaeus vannamei TaxID=6689 RepID=A0A3R7M9J4_PENVA|nr:putative zinc finger homeobox protein 3 [Penaeus vannamei]